MFSYKAVTCYRICRCISICILHFFIFKGKLKPKKFQALVSSLQPVDKFLGSKFSKKRLVGLKTLRAQKESKEDDQVFVGAVTVCFSPPEGVPVLVGCNDRPAFFLLLFSFFTFCDNSLCSGCILVDAEGESVGMTVYNLTKSFHFSTGDVLTISDPFLEHIFLPQLVCT